MSKIKGDKGPKPFESGVQFMMALSFPIATGRAAVERLEYVFRRVFNGEEFPEAADEYSAMFRDSAEDFRKLATLLEVMDRDLQLNIPPEEKSPGGSTTTQ